LLRPGARKLPPLRGTTHWLHRHSAASSGQLSLKRSSYAAASGAVFANEFSCRRRWAARAPRDTHVPRATKSHADRKVAATPSLDTRPRSGNSWPRCHSTARASHSSRSTRA